MLARSAERVANNENCFGLSDDLSAAIPEIATNTSTEEARELGRHRRQEQG